jgi:hypothetical protein
MFDNDARVLRYQVGPRPVDGPNDLLVGTASGLPGEDEAARHHEDDDSADPRDDGDAENRPTVVCDRDRMTIQSCTMASACRTAVSIESLPWILVFTSAGVGMSAR